MLTTLGTKEPEFIPVTPNIHTHRGTPPRLERKNIHSLVTLKNMRKLSRRLSNPRTPPDTDKSGLDTDESGTNTDESGGDDIDIEQARGHILVVDNPFSSDEITEYCSPCVDNQYAELFPTSQIYSHTDSSTLFKNPSYHPYVFGSSDDGSEESISEIPEEDEGLFFGDIGEADTSNFYMDIPEKASQPFSRLWGKPGELLIYRKVAILEPRHLQEFDDDERLTNETFNYCMKSLLESSAVTSKIFVLSSFFYTNLQRGSSDTIDHGSVSRWPGNQGCLSLYDAEYLLLPIYDETIQHWFLVIAGNVTPGERLLAGAIDAQRSTAFVTVLDSLGSRPEHMRVANHIRSYICLEACTKFDMEFDESCIEIKLPKQVLQQNNDTDCGFYVLEHARRFFADPAAFLQRIFRGQLAMTFDVAMMRAQLARGIIQDKQQQDLDSIIDSREVTHDPGLTIMRPLASQIDKDLDAEGEHSLNAGNDEVVTKHIDVETQKGVDGILDAEVNFEGLNPQQDVIVSFTTPRHPHGQKKNSRHIQINESDENRDPEITSEDQSQQVKEVGKSKSLGTQRVNLKRAMLQVEDNNLILPIHAGTPASAKSLYGMEQFLRYKRWRTKNYSTDLSMDEVSPQMIVQMIVATEQLAQLATVPLLQDHEERDLVDSKTWRLLEDYITQRTLPSGPVIEPNSIIKDMGFPSAAHLPETFGLSRGEVFHDATSVLPNFISAVSASEEDHNSNIHSFRQYLSDYTSSAERAIASAQVLRELVRRSQNAVQSLQLEYDKDVQHLKIYAPTPSEIRSHIQASAQRELELLMHSLKVLFERTQNMVNELKEYRLQLEVAQKDV
jgi:hypothetical protein